MGELTSMALFGLGLSLGAFELGKLIQKKCKNPAANPLLIAIVLVIAVLQIFHIPYEDYEEGGKLISIFLGPATICLAVTVYRQVRILKANVLPILVGTAVGSAASILTVIGLCYLFRLDQVFHVSLIPKSVTTPIAMEISRAQNGIVPVTVAAVVLTGILGAIISPLLIRVCRIKNPVTAGVAIGTSSHVIGTSKAVELGEVEGAMSSISLVTSGLITVIYSLFL